MQYMDKSSNGRGAEGRYKRPNFPMEFKRQLAEQSFEPGASVALIARQNDVNANLLFRWRHQYLDGAFGLPTIQPATPVTESQAPTLLPVSIVEDAPATTPATRSSIAEDTRAEYGVCEVDFDHARLRVRGEVSPSVLRPLIRELSRLPETAR
jgi:transposase